MVVGICGRGDLGVLSDCGLGFMMEESGILGSLSYAE